MEKHCETCHSFQEHKKKVFLSDGICFLVPSKPQFKKKMSTCKWWKQRKGEKT